MFCSVNNICQIMWVKLSLKWTAVFWQYTHFFYQDLCYEEMPLLSSCPFHQVRRVGNTQKCSINKCTLFCLAKLQYKYFLTHPGYFPHLLIYFFMRHCWCMSSETRNHWTTWDPATTASRRSGHWTARGLSWRLGGAGIWGESSNQDRWLFIAWQNIYLPWVSKTYAMPCKHLVHSRTWKHSNIYSKILHFSKTSHLCL